MGVIVSEKKYGGTGLISEKNRKFCMQNVTKERKHPSVDIWQQTSLCSIFIPCL